MEIGTNSLTLVTNNFITYKLRLSLVCIVTNRNASLGQKYYPHKTMYEKNVLLWEVLWTGMSRSDFQKMTTVRMSNKKCPTPT